MFTHQLDEELSLALNHACYSEAIYALIDAHRAELREWLPWVDGTQSVAGVRSHLRMTLGEYAIDKGVTCVILYRGQPVGLVGFNNIHPEVLTGSIGYWLAPPFQGKGIMTRAVAGLIRLGFDYYDLRKAEIRCATGNLRSAAVAQRLGFQQEGVLRNNECVNGRYLDHRVFGLLRDEFEAQADYVSRETSRNVEPLQLR